MQLKAICKYLNQLLNVEKIQDYSLNGLQVEASDKISKIAFAVDASLSTFKKVAEAGANLLIVHHGLFWGKAETITGFHAKRLRFLFENNISLYAAHLPLDVHPELGNNAAILEGAGFSICGNYGYERGTYIGMMGEHKEGIPYKKVKENLFKILGTQPIATVTQEPIEKTIKKIGAVSGGGMKYGIEAASLGAELFISGEPSHAWFHPILETEIPCLLYGHYQTETLGLKRLLNHLQKEKECQALFIDNPTGM